MDELVTTCVQQQIRIFESHGEFRSDIQRFMRLAKIKESHLVVFPELCGLLLAPPLIPGLKRTLLRVAERQVKRKPSLFDRMVGRVADSASGMTGGISDKLIGAISDPEGTLRDAYLTIFSEVAREYGMYIVGGSVYLPDPSDGQVRNTAYLFSPTGEVIGQQSKIALSALDKLICQPTSTGLEAFETDFGKLSILIGQDVFYPESGRILAAAGAQFVAHLTASTDQGLFLKMRNAFAARLQENLLLGTQSYLVGRNILGQAQGEFIGKSAILAPVEMTTRYSGILAEVGTTVTEGTVSATWDIKGLYELRSATDLTFDNHALRNQIQRLYGAPAAALLAPAHPVEEEVPVPGITEEEPSVEEPQGEAPGLASEPSAALPLLAAAEEAIPEPEAGAPLPEVQAEQPPAAIGPEEFEPPPAPAQTEIPSEPELEAVYSTEPDQTDLSGWITEEKIYLPPEPLFTVDQAATADVTISPDVPEPDGAEAGFNGEPVAPPEDTATTPVWSAWTETPPIPAEPEPSQGEWPKGQWEFDRGADVASDSETLPGLAEPEPSQGDWPTGQGESGGGLDVVPGSETPPILAEPEPDRSEWPTGQWEFSRDVDEQPASEAQPPLQDTEAGLVPSISGTLWGEPEMTTAPTGDLAPVWAEPEPREEEATAPTEEVAAAPAAESPGDTLTAAAPEGPAAPPAEERTSRWPWSRRKKGEG